MDPAERYMKFKSIPFDNLLMRIRRGEIKSGKYSGLIKTGKPEKIGKEYTLNGATNEETADYHKRRQRLETIIANKRSNANR